jgi:hypothetical protein
MRILFVKNAPLSQHFNNIMVAMSKSVGNSRFALIISSAKINAVFIERSRHSRLDNGVIQ